MRIVAAALFFILAIAAATPAVAQAVDFDRDVLRAIDTVPTRAQLDGAFDDAPAKLREAAVDVARPTYERHRALSLLSLYPTPSTRAFLRGLSGADEPAMASRAVYTLARTFGPNADNSLAEFVVTTARSNDGDVREWAVRGLRWIDHPAAVEGLRHFSASADDTVASIAKRALRKHVRSKRTER